MQIERHQYGTALIVALLFMTLVTGMITAASIQQKASIQRIIAIENADTIYSYASYVTAWATYQLSQAMKIPDQNQQEFYNSLDQDWAKPMPTYYQETAAINGYIIDMEGLFDLNNLRNKNMHVIFEQLLELLSLNPEYAKRIATSNILPLISVSELLLVPGMTPEAYAILQPFVWTLPVNFNTSKATITRINVNTAPNFIIAALLGIDLKQTAIILENRPFKQVNDFKAAIKSNSMPKALEQQLDRLIDVKSSYFLVIAQVESLNQEALLYTLLQRKPNATIDVIWQSLGGI